ncbi:MAG: lytic transglycosylase domain-containing protein [Clostridiales Family XIII bacterium]|jgi:hypothetical protein|nr:lytic transglycosylase domain-containing protein [Clostridiales Family XIII bacterium]
MTGIQRILTAWLIVAALVLSSAAVYAGDRAEGSFFLKNIVVNGEKIVNYNLQYPFFMYEDVTYLPLTADMQEIFGFTADVDIAAGTLTLRKTASTLTNIRDNRVKNNAENVETEVESRVSVSVADAVAPVAPPPEYAAEFAEIIVFDPAPQENVRAVDLGQSPVLVKDKTVYLPLRAFAGNEVLGWSLYYDPYFGICISTNENVPAQTFFPEAEAKYNSGLTQYIRSVNGNLSASRALEMVFMLRRAAEVNKLDEKVLIAVVQKESRFNAKAVSRSGAVGLMQFMPQTAAGLGLSVEQLYDPKTSIDYGAAYLSRNIENYGGNVDLALIAYNQGSGSVSRGTYSRVYAERVQDTADDIDAYLEGSGYVSPE